MQAKRLLLTKKLIFDDGLSNGAQLTTELNPFCVLEKKGVLCIILD